MIRISLKHIHSGYISLSSKIPKTIASSKQLFAVRVHIPLSGFVTRGLSTTCIAQQRFKEDEIRFNGIRIQLQPDDVWTEENFEQELIRKLMINIGKSYEEQNYRDFISIRDIFF